MLDVCGDARRGIQSQRGSADVADVMAGPFAIEAKRKKRVRLPEAMDQAEACASLTGKIPVVAVKYIREEDHVKREYLVLPFEVGLEALHLIDQHGMTRTSFPCFDK